MHIPHTKTSRQRLWHFHGGLMLDDCKTLTSERAIKLAEIPKKLFIPLHQHIGDPAVPVVEIGERVLAGQLIARAASYISAPVHASSSGTVVEIGDYPVPHPSGFSAPCIVIQTDGRDEWIATLETDVLSGLDADEIRERIRQAGITGLGGASFPTSVKLNPGPDHPIETLVVNGVECEPYITSDDRLMRERAVDIVNGIRVLFRLLEPQHCIIAVEDNKAEAIAELSRAVDSSGLHDTRVQSIPTRYPSGGEKQLIKILTGQEIPYRSIPAHVGIIMQNVGTVAAIAQALLQHRPMVSRIVTVTGRGIVQPENFEVRIGTPVADLIAQTGGYNDHVSSLVMGGPMMGFALHSDDVPVTKAMNCIIAADAAELPAPTAAQPCIRCGECARVCPANLLPQQLYWYARAKDLDKTQDYNLFDCIECGCCAYVCPSRIPLVQYYRFAKNEVWAQESEREKSDHARIRHEARLARLERLEQERQSRLRKKKEALNKNAGGDDPKKAAIAEAMKRVAAKKAQQQSEPKNVGNLNASQQKAVDEANARRKQNEPADKE